MLENSPQVSIILVHYNALDDVLRCIASLRSLEYEKFYVVIVDNCSEPVIKKKLSSELASLGRVGLDAVTLIENETNDGFAAANNVGLRWSEETGVKYVWLLNADTEVSPSALRALVSALERDARVGACGSKIVYPPDAGSPKADTRIWSAGGEVNREKCTVHMIGSGEIDRGQFNTAHACDYLPGCSALLRMSAVQEIGPMPEQYFLYFEETDWFLRFKDAGWELRYVPESVVVHHFEDSKMQTPQTVYYYNRNQRLFWFLHSTTMGKLRVLLRALLSELPRNFRAYCSARGTENEALFRAHFQSVLDFVALRFGRRG